ncbi:MAG: GTPase HflX, partial [Acidobacteria bacterium]|nr:GTPase HflX [Acidobacteriota bacterium]
QQDIETVRKGRTIQRRQRQGVPLATVAMAGYTNAGKSTLFNRLTGADVVADARMFATLDPTVRHLILPSRRKVLMSDTVGFIRNLPTTLVKAFRATLEEVVEAKLILHVVDASSASGPQQTAQVMKVLAEIGAAETPQILVLNKADLLSESPDAHAIAARLLSETEEKAPPRAVCVSARTGQGMAELLRMVDDVLSLDPIAPARFRLPLGEGGPLSLLHEWTQVSEVKYLDDACEVECIAPESIRRRLAQYLVRDKPTVH